MPEQNLNAGLRLLLGVLGAVAVGSGGVVGATEVRIAAKFWPDWPAAAVAAFCGVVIWGGVILLRGAASGRIAVRRTRRPGSAK